MPFTPIAGINAALKFGTTTPITVPATDWTLNIDPKLKDVSNFLTGRLKIKTLPDAKLTCKIIWDTATMPTDPAGLNITDGATVIARCYVSATQWFEIPGVVARFDPSLGSVEDVVMLSIEIDLSGGVVIYPTAPAP